MTNKEDALSQIADIAARNKLNADDIVSALNQQQAPDQAKRTSSVLARVLAYLGGIFVLAGIALFINMQWDQFGSAARVLVTLGTGFAIYLFALLTMTDERFARVTTPLLLVSALLQPTGILVMLEEYAYGRSPEQSLLFMCVVMFVQQFLTFLAKNRSVLLFTSIFFGAAGFGVFCDILDVDFKIISLALGIGLICVCYVTDKTVHKAVTPFWYLAGSIFFLSGTFELLEGKTLEVVFFGFAAGVMYLGTVVRSRVLLFVGVIAITSYTGYYFRDSLANALGLIVLGFLLIGLSAFAMRLNRKYIRAE